MLIVHHLGISQSERIVWLCEELGIPYELKRYDRDPTTRMAPASYKALHPMGIAPVITDGSLVLAESGAICEYIIARHGGGRFALRADHPDFAQYLFWFHFANGTMMPTFTMDMVGPMAGLSPDHPLVQAFANRGVRAWGMLEKRCGESTWLAGSEFTAADIMMGFPLTTMRMFVPRDLAKYPNVRAYLQRVGARPAYQRAMAKGDPGMPLQLT